MRTTDVAPSSPRALFERWRYLPLLALVAAMWPVWQWLAMRAMSDASDAWALLSLATALALLWRSDARRPPRWSVAVLLVLTYAASYAFVPPLVRALIAMSAVAAACSSLWFGSRMNLPLWGLLLLSPPLIPTLNFYLGYPLRVMVGEITSALLQMNGFAAGRDGTTLLWDGQQISIDAPCSGIRMLWTGMYLSCALAGLQRLDAKRTLVLASFALIVVIIANVLRATALFYIEAGIVPQAQPAHEIIGVMIFVLAAISIGSAAARLRPHDAAEREQAAAG
jgi:exosortase